jgi:hypothetical protein
MSEEKQQSGSFQIRVDYAVFSLLTSLKEEKGLNSYNGAVRYLLAHQVKEDN